MSTVLNGLSTTIVLDTDIGNIIFNEDGSLPFDFNSTSGEFSTATDFDITFGNCCRIVPQPNELWNITFRLNAMGTMGINCCNPGTSGAPYGGPAILTIVSLGVVNSDATNLIFFKNYGSYPASFTLNYDGCDASSGGCAPAFTRGLTRSERQI